MNGSQIQELRRSLGENAETFGRRFAVSGRTVEGWEQEHRTPSALIQRLLQELKDAHGKPAEKKTSSRKTR